MSQDDWAKSAAATAAQSPNHLVKHIMCKLNSPPPAGDSGKSRLEKPMRETVETIDLPGLLRRWPSGANAGLAADYIEKLEARIASLESELAALSTEVGWWTKEAVAHEARAETLSRQLDEANARIGKLRDAIEIIRRTLAREGGVDLTDEQKVSIINNAIAIVPVPPAEEENNGS